jgi:concanavalin A-like lectin/glucanase superfamily protein
MKTLPVLLVSLVLASSAHGADLKQSLLLCVSFDKSLDADIAAGDPKLYHSPSSSRSRSTEGLPPENLVLHAKEAGRFGQGLRFTKKMKPVVFFKGEKNLGYNTNSWSGSCSFWLRLDPDKDLEPGYCDPLQFVAQAWGEGNMFVEFSKDHTPRHFRYAILSVTKHWNPNNRGWEEIPEAERPMVPVHKPAFARDQWTHVVFTFSNINSGRKNSVGKLYLNGKPQGSFGDREHIFNWDIAKSALTIGLNYIGDFDDLAVFNVVLSDEQVLSIYRNDKSVASL